MAACIRSTLLAEPTFVLHNISFKLQLCKILRRKILNFSTGTVVFAEDQIAMNQLSSHSRLRLLWVSVSNLVEHETK